MAVMQMQKMSICALKQDRKKLLEKLQSAGVIEICQSGRKDAEKFETVDTLNARQSFEKAMSTMEQAISLLDAYNPKKSSPFAALAGKELIEAGVHTGVVGKKEDLQKEARRLIRMDRDRAALLADVTKLENQVESLTPWLALDVSQRDMETKRTSVIPGTFQGHVSLEDIYRMFGERLPGGCDADAQILFSDDAMTCVAVYCLQENRTAVEDALRSYGFSRPAVSFDDVPIRMKERLQEQIKDSVRRSEELAEQIAAAADKRHSFVVLSDYYRVRIEKYEVLGALLHTQKTFMLTGYIPAREAGKLKESLTGMFDCIVDVSDVEEGEESPILLKNNPFSASFEGVLEGYGVPMPGEVDPTTIMSFFYIFFFGMMLSDAAYGAIIAVACFVALKKFPRMEAGMKKSLQLFFYCGLSTLVWGVLFGGYFGNIVDIVSGKFFGHTVTVPALWFVPLSNPMKLLVYSMAFGVIHLFTGLGIKGYICIRDKRYMDFVCDVVLWVFLLVGLILMLLPSSLFASIAQTQIVLPAAVNTLAKALAIIGAVGIVLMSGRASKNPALRVALGAYDLYNITGWLSDVLSYSRLLALGLATGVIASVINQMGSMMPNNVVGVIGFILIFVIGHTLNLAINLLGAYVHTNRLQFVEFFSKFYEGGGRVFHPFMQRTKYTDIKEDTVL